MALLEMSILPPVEELVPYVRRVLITEAQDLNQEIIPIGPTGFCYFTFSKYPLSLHYRQRLIRSDRQLYLAGQLKNEQPYFKVSGPLFHIGLELLPSALHYFFQMNSQQMVDDVCILPDLWPTRWQSLLAALNKSAIPHEVAELLQEELIRRLSQVQPVDYIEKSLHMIYAAKGIIDMDTLTSTLPVGGRQFRRMFGKIVGLSPKQYCKVIQFNAVFDAINKGNAKEIHDLALKHGYYDQAHFIHDFKMRLGQSPQAFFKSRHYFLRHYLGSFINQ